MLVNITKWPNTLKQFVGKLPTNCLSVSDHFVGLVYKGLTVIWKKTVFDIWKKWKFGNDIWKKTVLDMQQSSRWLKVNQKLSEIRTLAYGCLCILTERANSRFVFFYEHFSCPIVFLSNFSNDVSYDMHLFTSQF